MPKGCRRAASRRVQGRLDRPCPEAGCLAARGYRRAGGLATCGYRRAGRPVEPQPAAGPKTYPCAPTSPGWRGASAPISNVARIGTSCRKTTNTAATTAATIPTQNEDAIEMEIAW